MKKFLKKKLVCAACGAVFAAALSFGPVSPFQITAEAHCGSRGGHHGGSGYTTQSSYYYCGGHEAHRHNGGACPYAVSNNSDVRSQSTDQVLGWHHDDRGWRYRNTENSCYADCMVNIDGSDCYFDADGYLKGDR